jgi:hypothetical protein
MIIEDGLLQPSGLLSLEGLVLPNLVGWPWAPDRAPAFEAVNSEAH